MLVGLGAKSSLKTNCLRLLRKFQYENVYWSRSEAVINCELRLAKTKIVSLSRRNWTTLLSGKLGTLFTSNIEFDALL